MNTFALVVGYTFMTIVSLVCIIGMMHWAWCRCWPFFLDMKYIYQFAKWRREHKKPSNVIYPPERRGAS